MRRWIITLALAVAYGGLLYGDAAAQVDVASAAGSLRLVASQSSAPSLTLPGNAYAWQAAQRSSSRRVPTLAPLPDDVGVLASEEAPPADIQPDETAPEATAYDPGYDDLAGGAGCRCRGGGALRCGKPFKLIDPAFLRCRGIAVGGWLQHGITFNAEDPADRFNGPVATNDRDGEYLMNQLWLFVDRPVNTGGWGWDIGGHVDILYGSDFRFGINHGLEDRINSLDNPYGVVIPQAYLEIGVNNLSVKLGHFAGILDYEVVPAPPNPFYSHSYSYGYTVPQLVTGVLATYKLSDQWSVAAGFHRGWMMFEDVNDDLDFMGGVMWASRNKRTSATFAISTGAQDPIAGENNRFVYSFVLKHLLTNRLQYILVQNLGYEDDGVLGKQEAQDAEWYGINQYFLYKINPCWSACLRVEWLRDDDGARIFGIPNIMPPVRTWPGGPGFAGDFYELTVGLNWRPHPNVTFRPECRWDWYNGTRGPRNGGTELPFDGGNKDEQFTFAVDMIVTY